MKILLTSQRRVCLLRTETLAVSYTHLDVYKRQTSLPLSLFRYNLLSPLSLLVQIGSLPLHTYLPLDVSFTFVVIMKLVPIV